LFLAILDFRGEEEKIKANGSFLASMVGVEKKLNLAPTTTTMYTQNNFDDIKIVIVETLKELKNEPI
jgi:hypothetical protein